MAKISKISWTDGTLNFWEGCEKISEGCLNCYAENRDQRWHGGKHWGRGAPRKLSKSAIPDLRKFQKNTEEGRFVRCAGCGVRRWRSDECCGVEAPHSLVRPTFFVMSLGDFGDDAVPDDWRAEALVEMLRSTAVDFMILTKRPEALRELWARALLKMTATWQSRILAWLDGSDVPSNIAIGATVESDKTAEKRLYHLADFPACRRFISAEPLLSGGWSKLLGGYPAGTFHLVIAGGESLTAARPMHPRWPREIEITCDVLDIPFHFKQWGEWVPADVIAPDWTKPVTGNFLVVRPDRSVRPFDAKRPAEGDEVLVWRAGVKASGHACDKTGRTRTERLTFPLQPWKDSWWIRRTTPPRYFPGLVPAQEWAAAQLIGIPGSAPHELITMHDGPPPVG